MLLREPARRVRSRVARGLRAGAWFFIVFSMAHLAWVLAVLIADPSGAIAMYGALDPSVGPTASGLHYAGSSGIALAIGQLVAVVAGLGLTLTRTRRARRIGHLLLLGWAGMWTVAMLGLLGAVPGPESLARAGLMAVLFGCTLGRAAMGWTPAARSLPEPEVDDADASPLRMRAGAIVARGGRRVREHVSRLRGRRAESSTPDEADWRRDAAHHGRAAVAAVGGAVREGLRRGQDLAREKGLVPASRTGSAR